MQMPYKTGDWGEQAKERSSRRKEYFKNRIRAIVKIEKHKKEEDETGLGAYGERLALKILQGSTLERKSGYDILWKNKKIEVKISNCQKQINTFIKKWFFNVQRQRNKTDYFLLILINKDKENILKVFLMPNSDISGKSTLSISENQLSLYEKYMVEMR